MTYALYPPSPVQPKRHAPIHIGNERTYHKRKKKEAKVKHKRWRTPFSTKGIIRIELHIPILSHIVKSHVYAQTHIYHTKDQGRWSSPSGPRSRVKGEDQIQSPFA
jgi:hypothetical protein